MLSTDILYSPLEPGWSGNARADFLGREYNVPLVFSEEEDGDYSRQLDVFKDLARQWDDIQLSAAEVIVGYYNSEMRFSYGPDDESQMSEMWPEITSPEQLSGYVSLDTIILPCSEDMDDIYGGNTVFLCLSYTFGDDTDAEGIGVRITDNIPVEIGTSDIAY